MRDLRSVLESPAPTLEEKIVDAFASGARRVLLRNADGVTLLVEMRDGELVATRECGVVAAIVAAQAKRDRKAARRLELARKGRCVDGK